MSIELNNNFDLKKAAPLDEKLSSVADVGSLPDPMVAANFIYEGAVIYVIDVKANYQAQDDPDNPATLIWVNIGGGDCCTQVNIGTITVPSGTGDLDMDDVIPAISTCHTVNIVVTGGTTYQVNSISNMPSSQETKFTTSVGNAITFIHTNYSLAGAGDIVMEVGFDYVLTGRSIANESLTLVKEGNALTQVTGEQFINAQALCDVISNLGVTVIDNLNSESTVAALSANQGNILLGLLQDKQDAFGINGLLSWNNDQTQLTANYPDFIFTNSPTNISNVGGYLTSQVPSNTKHQIIKVSTTGAITTLHGVWLLPGGKDPGVFTNWIQLSSTFSTSLPFSLVSITEEPVVDGTTAEADGTYYLRMNEDTMNNFDGGVGATFNPGDGVSERVNIKLPTDEVFEVNLTVECTTDEWENFVLKAYRHNTFGSITDAIPGAYASVDAWPVSLPASAASSNGTYVYSVILRPSGTVNKFSFAWEPRAGVGTPNLISRAVVGGQMSIKKLK